MATPVKYRNGLIATITFHGALLLLLLFLAFRTPLPLPEEQGILVDFGNSNTGFGSFEPRLSDQAMAQSRPAARTPQSQEQSLTQDMEETVALHTNKPRDTPNDTPTETRETTRQTQPATPPTPERNPDPRAMFPGRGEQSSAATSQGEAGGQGNQGSPTGAPNVHIYGEGGDGTGNRWSLAGRNIVGSLPKPNYDVRNESGIVVVEITVDQNGNVIQARPGVSGSSTTNKALYDAAEKAARQAKFSPNPNAITQRGRITYIFKLQGE